MGRFGKKIWLALSALAILCASSLTPTANAAGLLTPVGGQQSLAVESQKVDVRINNGVAVTTVTQVFRNAAAQPLEALYTFPVPREASVSNFSMWINGKEVIGEMLERQQARQIYQQVTRVERKDPGLLEQVDHKTFEMRVFPVPARGTQQASAPCDVSEHGALLAAVRHSSAGTRIFTFGIGNEINRPLAEAAVVAAPWSGYFWRALD